jgi:hypothetical protein
MEPKYQVLDQNNQEVFSEPITFGHAYLLTYPHAILTGEKEVGVLDLRESTKVNLMVNGIDLGICTILRVG